MRNMNKTISLILVLSLVLACGAFGSAAADGIEQEGIGTQLKLISSGLFPSKHRIGDCEGLGDQSRRRRSHGAEDAPRAPKPHDRQRGDDI